MIPFSNFEEIKPEEVFNFKCTHCGECCRNVKNTVMLESLDLYRLAKHLNLETAEVVKQYTETVTVAWGALILVLKTKPVNDVCVFLKSGKCGIHSCSPRTCRLYLLSTGPEDDDIKNFVILKSPERQFHYTGDLHKAGEWVKENMDDESYEYITAEYKLLRELGKIMKRIPREKEDIVIARMLLFRFVLLETNQDFMPQFLRNMAMLKQELESLL